MASKDGGNCGGDKLVMGVWRSSKGRMVLSVRDNG